MVELIKCYVREDLAWEKKSIEQLTIREAVLRYNRVQLFLSIEGSPVQINLKEVYLKLGIGDVNKRISSWLNEISDFEPYLDKSPIKQLKDANLIKVSDTWDLPAKISFSTRTYHPDNDVIPDADKKELMLTNKGDDAALMSRLSRTCLFTVNGLLTTASSLNDRLYLDDSPYLISAENNQLFSSSCIDFSQIGELTTCRLEDTMFLVQPALSSDDVDTRTITATLPYNVLGKTTFISINGRPNLNIKNISVVGENSIRFKINIRHILNNMVRDGQPNEIAANLRNQGLSLENLEIKDILLSIPVFFFTITADDVSIFSRPLGTTKIPTQFTFPTQPVGMLLLDSGKLADYAVVGKHGNSTTISIRESRRYRPADDGIFLNDLGVMSMTNRNTIAKEYEHGRIVNFYTL